MIKVYVGLPASGKSYYIDKEKDDKAEVLDDVFTLSPNCLTYYIDEYIKNGKNIFIADPRLCEESQRDKLNHIIYECGYDEEIRWIYFENDADKAIKNLNYRQRNGDKRVVSKLWIKDLSKRYTIPAGIEPLTIWSEDDDDT